MLNIKEYEAMTKLCLSGDERERIAKIAEELTARFAALEHINTDEVQPLITALSLNNILREDISKKLLSRDDILSNAPEQYDGYFKVPGTLD